MDYPDWNDARDAAQRTANHWQQPACVLKVGGQCGLPLTWRATLASRNDSDFDRCEMVYPDRMTR